MWFINDPSPSKGTQLKYLTSLHGLKQLIAELTRVLESGIDFFIFTNQPILTMDSEFKVKMASFPMITNEFF